MKLALICAMAENRVIGRNNSLPWHLSEDLKYFKRVTMGNSIIMGRKTWESIGQALPGRTNIILTMDSEYKAEGARVVHSVEEAIRLAENISLIDGSEEAFIIGGAKLYYSALPLAERFHLTRVHADVEGDTYLAKFDETQWEEIMREEFYRSGDNPYDYSICLLQRIESRAA
ncbi:MAG: dihydrofolate reductase [Gammaproteobacteria bacterium]|nr:dihydrofolate reductase [Gammaproteobacteria bacterium]MCH2578629.1 dihydrofolate reductase [Pseudomonadales bacterium]MEC7767084.1 dihydrofolate reductase [Pseudomonadota bacterium]MEC8950527.1 dihydrofolate reductase [Pseudomonadota bacterium]MEC9218468.1 dihydrofolate reductase [Pseudomonadota bacterium]|tara:strand:- start:7405 stop:7923 length:519 start_codon:yes stop_codon:yes gene_type:complete